MIEENQLFGIFAFLLGLCVGSFLNVVIYRLPRSKSIMKPSSRCGFCKSSIPFWMNIPLVSFLISGGKCVKCGFAYSSRYFVIELLTGILFFVLWSIYGLSLSAFVYAFLISVLVATTFIDMDFRIVPDSLSLGGWAFGLFLASLPLRESPLSFVDSVVGGLVGAGGFWLVSRIYYFIRHEEGLGGGDVKLMGLIGTFLGVHGVLTTVLVGSIVGTFISLGFIIFAKRTKHFPTPFVPSLSLGALVSIFGIDRGWWG